MSKQLMEIVLPRLARPLYQHLEQFQLGKLNELQFTRRFEKELQKQHHWLAERGIEVAKAAVAIHAAVIVLSLPGLRVEAKEGNTPLEVLEFRASAKPPTMLPKTTAWKWPRPSNRSRAWSPATANSLARLAFQNCINFISKILDLRLRRTVESKRPFLRGNHRLQFRRPFSGRSSCLTLRAVRFANNCRGSLEQAEPAGPATVPCANRHCG